MTQWHDVGPVDMVAEGDVVGASAGGKPVALFLQEGTYYALYDLCSHGQAKLSEGYVEDGCIECPLHQGLVCIATGAPKSAPITEAVQTFEVRLSNGRLEVGT
jgi:nitrite reductase/ring-hydroxylating ferredoxin subunit